MIEYIYVLFLKGMGVVYEQKTVTNNLHRFQADEDFTEHEHNIIPRWKASKQFSSDET